MICRADEASSPLTHRRFSSSTEASGGCCAAAGGLPSERALLPRIRTASAPNQANHPDEPHDQLSLTRNASALSRIFILPISTGV